MRVRQRSEDVPNDLGLELSVPMEHAHWVCPCQKWSRSVTLDADLFAERLSLRQNAQLLHTWARAREPPTSELAELAWTDAGNLADRWRPVARSLIAEHQREADMDTQLGGVGVDVEIGEVCFRARVVRFADGTLGKEWRRYIAFVERGARKMVLRPLPLKYARGSGQGGGGQLQDEELYAAIFPEGRPPLLRPGTVVHTDSAGAYRNLGVELPSAEDPPQAVVDALLAGGRPVAWRRETENEADERTLAETREGLRGPSGGRSEYWAAKYRHLRLSHTAVVHKSGKKANRQFVVVRRAVFPPRTQPRWRRRAPTLYWSAGPLGGVTEPKRSTATGDCCGHALRPEGTSPPSSQCSTKPSGCTSGL